MSQREYNLIYRGPLIAFLRLDRDTQLAFIELAAPGIQKALRNAIHVNETRGFL